MLTVDMIRAFLEVFNWRPQYGQMANVDFQEDLLDKRRLGEVMKSLREELFKMGKPDERKFVMVPMRE